MAWFGRTFDRIRDLQSDFLLSREFRARKESDRAGIHTAASPRVVDESTSDAVQTEHLEKLKEGVEAWNGWRINNPHIIPNLSGVDFTSVELWEQTSLWRKVREYEPLRKIQDGYLDLRGCNFSNCLLNGARLSGAWLDQANFEGAHLRAGNLIRARLRGTNFSAARMEAANLSDAQGSSPLFRRANLSEANLSASRIYGAVFEDAVLVRAVLKGAYLYGANLRRADFSEANLTDVELFPATMENSNWRGANVVGITYDRRGLNNKCRAIGGVSEMYGDGIFQRDIADQDYVDTLRYALDSRAPILGGFDGNLAIFGTMIIAVGMAGLFAPIVWLLMVAARFLYLFVNRVFRSDDDVLEWRDIFDVSDYPSLRDTFDVVRGAVAAVDDALASAMPLLFSAAAGVLVFSLAKPTLLDPVKRDWVSYLHGSVFWVIFTGIVLLPALPVLALFTYGLVDAVRNRQNGSTGAPEGIFPTIGVVLFIFGGVLIPLAAAATWLLAGIFLLSPDTLGDFGTSAMAALRSGRLFSEPFSTLSIGLTVALIVAWVMGASASSFFRFALGAIFGLVGLAIIEPGSWNELAREFGILLSTRIGHEDLSMLFSAAIVALGFGIAQSVLAGSWLAGRGWFWVWDNAFDCGRDWTRVLIFAVVCVAILGGFYAEFESAHRIAYGSACAWPELAARDLSIQHPFYPWFVATLGFATLGISGLVTACDGWGQLLMIANVTLGFLTLGLLLAVLGNGFARRA